MLVIDTETGGLDWRRCALVSVGAIHAESGAEFSMLIRPHEGLDLDAGAMEVTGLQRDHLLEHGTDEGDALRMFAMWLHVFGPQEWCGCNPEFDRGFLDAGFARHGIEKRLPRRPVCLQTLAWLAADRGLISLAVGSNGMPKRSLDAILEAVGLARSSAKHDALEDARLTLGAYRKIKARFDARIQISGQ